MSNDEPNAPPNEGADLSVSPHVSPEIDRRTKWPWFGGSSLLAGLVAFGVYAYTLAPTVTPEDSGELIAAAYLFGVPHPPGYPLWTMLCGAFTHLIPVGSVAWRANLFSALTAAAAIGILNAALRAVDLSRLAAIGASLSVAFGLVYWSQSVITEVYALNCLVFASLLLCVLRWYKDRQDRYLLGASALLGLGMCNHHTIAFSAVGMAAWILFFQPQLLKRPKLIALSLLVFTVSLLPHTYLLVSARMDPAVNWGDPSSWERLIAHVDRQQYKGGETPKPSSETSKLTQKWEQARIVASMAWKEHTRYLGILTLIGFAIALFKRRALAFLVLLLTFCQVGLFLLMSEVSDSRQGLWVTRVFFIPQYMLAGVLLALCLDAALSTIRRIAATGTPREKPYAVKTFACILPLICLIPLVTHWRENNYRHHWFAYDHAVNMLNSMLPNALVFPSGDHNTFPLIYVHYVEGMRPDITIADKYGYIEPSLYEAMPGYEGRLPRTPDERKEIEKWIISRARRPVYYTVKKDTEISQANLFPVGVLYHLLPEGKPFDQDTSWDFIQYRNVESPTLCKPDYGADNILSDYRFFSALNQIRVGHTTNARLEFERAAEHGRGIPGVYNNIGCAFAEHAFPEEAISYYVRAGEVDPGYVPARWNLARLYKAHKQWAKAEEVFGELAKETPDDYRVFGELGFLGLLRNKPVGLCIGRFEESLRLNPAQPQIIMELANIYAGANANPPVVPEKPEVDAPPAAPPQAAVGESSGDCLAATHTEWNFGTVKGGQTLTHAFELANPSSRPITIVDYTRSCGCITPIFTETTVHPKQTLSLEITLSLPEKPDRLHHFVEIITDAKKCPALKLALRAEVQAP